MKDSNLRRRLPADLQSAPFGHLGNRPEILCCSHTQPLPVREQSWKASSVRQLSTEADDGNRTHNLPLTRRLLCRLSYVGACKPPCKRARAIIPEPDMCDKGNNHERLVKNTPQLSKYILQRGVSLSGFTSAVNGALHQYTAEFAIPNRVQRNLQSQHLENLSGYALASASAHRK